MCMMIKEGAREVLDMIKEKLEKGELVYEDRETRDLLEEYQNELELVIHKNGIWTLDVIINDRLVRFGIEYSLESNKYVIYVEA